MRSRFKSPTQEMIPASEVPEAIRKDEPPEWSSIAEGIRLNLAPALLTVVDNRDQGTTERGWRVTAFIWMGPLAENERVMRLDSATSFHEHDCADSVNAEFGHDIIRSLVRFLEENL
jgi:hypothetical protein